MFSQRAAEGFSFGRMLQHQRALQIVFAMQSAGQHEMSLEECARSSESFDNFGWLHIQLILFRFSLSPSGTMPMMQLTFNNLVSDSTLVQETIDLLRRKNGRVSAAQVASEVLQLPDLEPAVAALIIAELVRDDWRVQLTDEHEVELLCADDECRVLAETDFVVVDVETTGAKTPPGRITEIGAYRVSQNRIVAEFQTLVNPQTNIPPFIVHLTGITEKMVKDAPVFNEVVPEWLRFIGDAVLVAHNALFDVRFINHEIARVFPGRRMVNPHLCTVLLSRGLIPELQNHRLHTLAEHFAISIINRHRAAGDARATAEVFLHLLAHLQQIGVYDLAGVRQFKQSINGHGTRPKVSVKG